MNGIWEVPKCKISYITLFIIQGGSNMTGTDLCVNKPHKSRSYLNHLVIMGKITQFLVNPFVFVVLEFEWVALWSGVTLAYPVCRYKINLRKERNAIILNVYFTEDLSAGGRGYLQNTLRQTQTIRISQYMHSSFFSFFTW